MSWVRAYSRQVQAAVSTNASAFGYSLVMTATFGALSRENGGPNTVELFVFLVGAALSFSAIEVVATGGFRRKLQEESPDLVLAGSSVNLFSLVLSLAAVYLVDWLFPSPFDWLLGPFAATLAYVLAVALQMTLVLKLQKSRKHEDSRANSG